ncbi:FtsJ-like methyltransferase-domain-containing protein [Aspergillus granulosus]|uniref:rRNA methyltransferase 2, mitochondrial n=1 Tax=Aspergillus granulosus TaxID=176169 RepID=A0ABR4GT82_9EURO
MALATARFEREYDQVYTRTAQLLDAERDRVQRMEKLLLRIENETLQSRLDQTSQDLVLAREAETDVRLQLDGAIRELTRLQGITQTSSREVENLHRELASLNAVASDSQKIQAEKVRLSKEVSSIHSELERLRSQNTSANVLLAEKQALTRQLNALEVELETEKRAHERALAKESQQTEQITTLASKLEETRRELDLARRHGQQMANHAPTANKADSISRKLEGAKGEATFSPRNDSRNSAKKKISSERTIMVPLRGSTSRLHSELNIATPGAVRAQKQQKQIPTMPGEKSSFSITPFLNRTTGLENSTMSSDDELNDIQSGGRDQLPDHARLDSSPVVSKQPKKSAPKHISKPDKDGPTTASIGKNPKNTEKPSLLDSPDKVGGYSIPSSHPMGQKQPQSKKRKLGLQRDRSLFDEDEDDNILQDNRRLGRKLAGAGQTNLTGARAFAGPAGVNCIYRVQRLLQTRLSSSKRWQARQLRDHFTRDAAVQGLKSRAAFKLLQGYAPGSWSQVALTRTQPNGRVLGVDIIPSQPPKGVSTIQGNFLDPEVQAYVREFLRNPQRGRPRCIDNQEGAAESIVDANSSSDLHSGGDANTQRTVDVVLSDMSAPWAQTTGFWKRSLSNPYNRMMNTSGVAFRDHAGSMDLCRAALEFSYEVLKNGGHFVCKFYQGAEDKELEKQLKALFHKVHRLKPESSRSVWGDLLESKEAFFIGLDRKPRATKEEVFTTA